MPPSDAAMAAYRRSIGLGSVSSTHRSQSPRSVASEGIRGQPPAQRQPSQPNSPPPVDDASIDPRLREMSGQGRIGNGDEEEGGDDPVAAAARGALGQQQRGHRAREDDTDDEAEQRPTQRTWSPAQAKQFAATVSSKNSLIAEERSKLADFAQLEAKQMLIDLKGHLMSQERQMLNGFINLFVKSDAFTTNLKHHVAAALLSPTIKAYVKGTAEGFIAHIQSRYDLFHLRQQAVTDPSHLSMIGTIARNRLTDFRSSMRKIIAKSKLNKIDIYQLSNQLIGKTGVKINYGHWGRFSFLRRMYGVWEEQRREPAMNEPDAPDESDAEDEKPEASFWKFVDAKLEGMRELVRDLPSNDGARQISDMFRDALDADIQDYPLLGGAPTINANDIPPWQVAAETSMNI